MSEQDSGERDTVSRQDFLAGLGYSAGGVVVGLAVGGLVASRTVGDDTPGGAAQVVTTPAPAPTAIAGTQTQVVPAIATAYPRLRIASMTTLEVGDVVDFEYPTEGSQASLVRLGHTAAGGIGPDGDVVAFSTDCTHMGCPLRGSYRPEHGIFGPRACHFTTFNLAHRGMVVIGPATENLPQILLDVEGDDLLAVGTLGILYGFRDNLADAPVVEGL